MSQATNNNAKRVETSVSPITVDEIKVGEYQKEGTETAQLRQTVTTVSYYPSKKIDSDLQDNIFDLKEFGFSEQSFTSSEVRIAWLNVPKGTTKEAVESKIKAAEANGAVLYKMLSNHPILDENQVYRTTIDSEAKNKFAEKQITRYPENHEQAGQLILDNNDKVQYRRIFFSASPKGDIDLRNNDANDFYASEEVMAELKGASVMEGQIV